MEIEIILEAIKFSERINSLSVEIVNQIKSQVLSAHSTRKEYSSSGSSNRDIVQQEVVSIEFNVHVSDHINVDLLTNKKIITTDKYGLSMLVITDNSTIHDGLVTFWVWQVLQLKIDFNEFPNFKKPEFSNHKQIL